MHVILYDTILYYMLYEILYQNTTVSLHPMLIMIGSILSHNTVHTTITVILNK